ncbi:MAG: helix-turn-helix domain-containing protein [Chloroflexi bacterium]|nr:helix-turn-helix domain-containing protein [Chloroflexota bacterium]
MYEDTISQSLFKATDVAEILNISKSMAYRLMQTREIPTVCIGAAKRVRPVDLHSYINQNLTPANA